MSLLKEQWEKEKTAGKKVVRGYSYILVVFWGLIGLAMIFSPAWPLGLILVGGAGYVMFRLNSKTQEKK